ncbi:hypothetical protein BHC44_02465 [Snodgrassella alvi]|jgi:hypothetical protein|uniref:Uncharacterized protein n=1 Tax=Snodgrassella alvi TaxID=1196083 RepID=A0A2N9XXW6_9NEIS|nr:hypothetical protein [Snodgrassella alvi]PIT55002.1 hypothetical protein BHC49_07220 [Snodgrassella alvi]PIT55342.1 hypothetical protein BHC44_02465 [Snodgrassella alvi]PIT58662.1 hypothetical protein BHC49_01025 [Snodgrassella alvi]PIT58732.1 hypothetical protein BHC49_00915 [Snodgrassella alvi]
MNKIGKDELIVNSILDELLNERLEYYKNNLSNSSEPINSDDPYARARSIIIKLSNEEQKKIFNFLRLVMIDTMSAIFGTIDGSHFPPNISGDFILEYDGDEIQGSLQDELIAKAEEIGVYD